MTEINCPQCGLTSTEVHKITTGLKVALQSTGQSIENLPEEVCGSCFEKLSESVSSGVRLRIEKENLQKRKIHLWNTRVDILKKGRLSLEHRAYAEAAVSYEKYLKVLEIIYDLEPGEITPEIFARATRNREISVVASVYWDLLRIYDTSPGYYPRMEIAAQKLLLFAPKSAAFSEIFNKATRFARTANNKGPIREFIKKSRFNSNKCFIATVCFDDQSDYDDILRSFRSFRDTYLLKSHWGQIFVQNYYRLSPKWALRIDKSTFLKALFRAPLRGVHKILRVIGY